MDEALDDALCEALERIETGGSVSTQWLKSRWPASWRELQDALELDREIAPAAPPKDRVGGVRLDGWIGSGGMGAVFEGSPDDAAARRLPSRVAVKLFHAALATDREFDDRFAREVEVGRGVAHAGLVRTLAAGVDRSDGRERPYLVMERVEGETLRALHDERCPVPEALCRRIGREVAEALAALHEVGAVHRDVKPENVILTHDGFVKVMDFGVAFVAEEARRTSTSGFVGTVLYAAPEQFASAGARIDGRADLYALGVVLYELATGAHPFQAKDAASALSLRMEGAARASSRRADVSPFLDAVLARLLEPDADRRFSTARELAGVLAQGEGSTWWRRTSIEVAAARRGVRNVVRVARVTPVVGREAELAELRDLYDRARDGEGACALVVGEAGIGKSRLVDELATRLAAGGEDFHFLYGACGIDGAGPFAAALREHLDEGALEERLAPLLGPMAPLAAEFAALLRGAPATGAVLARDATGALYLESLRTLARERPTILVVDDLHAASDDDGALLRDLRLAIGGDRLLLVGLSRLDAPAVPLDAAATSRRAVRIELRALPELDAARIVTELLEDAAAADVAQDVASRCDGNPLLLIGVVEQLRATGVLERDVRGAWRADRSRVGAVLPAGMGEMIRRRLEGLDDADRGLLDVAACVGPSFDPLLVADAAGVEPLTALRRFAAMAARGVVRSQGACLRFDHLLERDAVYASVGAERRPKIHAQIAASVGRRPDAAGPGSEAEHAVALCRHLLRAGDGARAAPIVLAAVDHLVARSEHGAAIALVDEALGVLPGPADLRVDLLLRRSERLNFLGRVDEAEQAAAQAVAIADGSGDAARAVASRVARAGALMARSRIDDAVRDVEAARDRCPSTRPDLRRVVDERLSAALLLAGRFDDARATATDAVAGAAERGDRPTEARASLTLAGVELSAGRRQAARDWAERAVAAAEGAGLCSVARSSRTLIAKSLIRDGEMAQAAALLASCRSDALALGDRRAAAETDSLAAQLHLTLGDVDAARVHARQELTAGRELGDPRIEAVAHLHLGGAAEFAGELAEALHHSERGLELSRAAGHRGRTIVCLANLAVSYMSLGAFDDAHSRATEALDAAQGLGDRRLEARSAGLLVAIAALRGDVAAAEAGYRRLLAQTSEHSLERRLNYSGELARLLAQTGRRDEAREVLADVVGRADAPGLALHRMFLSALGASVGLIPVSVAEALVLELETQSPLLPRLDVRLLLWRAGGGDAHLEEARRLQAHLRRHAPVEFRDSMIANHPLHRALHAASELRPH